MKFARFVIAYCIAVIVWGAFVRASGSGAGCGSHWPLCNGEMLPPSPRWQTVVEFSHRLTSGVSLILVAVLAWLKLRARPGPLLRRVAIAAVVFILLEALIGAGLVLLSLVEMDRSLLRVISISLHLVNTSLLMATLAILAGRREPQRLLPSHPGSRKILLAFAASFLGLGATGAVAALGDTLFRHGSLAEGFAADFSPTSHWLLPLRIYHPPLAILWGVSWIAWSGQFRDRPGLARPFWWVTGLILANFSIGLINIVFLAPIAVQLAHLLIANLVWVLSVHWAVEFANQTTKTVNFG